ncbi:MAG: SemiSWEET family transporter [Candidatus Omnitrophica bacterium]|jgi:MtN3 and saliva related transmembrane protein|nr:SemiSWEET family transporter [Candidatus Omnitrophota bacterium]
MLWTFIGALAATLTMFSFIPQIARSLRTRSVKDVSPVTLFQLSSGVFLWMVYGIARRDPIIIGANLITFITLAILIFLYFKYKNNSVTGLAR